MTKYGHLFERKAIEDWVKKNRTCPMTKKELDLDDIFPAYAVKEAIQEYVKKHEKEP